MNRFFIPTFNSRSMTKHDSGWHYPSEGMCTENWMHEKKDSNNRNDHTSGYSFWPSDSNIYSRAYRNDNMLGSHCDLLHQFSETVNGSETGNVYWFFDGIESEFNRPKPLILQYFLLNS